VGQSRLFMTPETPSTPSGDPIDDAIAPSLVRQLSQALADIRVDGIALAVDRPAPTDIAKLVAFLLGATAGMSPAGDSG
jgi:hypothetical protein